MDEPNLAICLPNNNLALCVCVQFANGLEWHSLYCYGMLLFAVHIIISNVIFGAQILHFGATHQPDVRIS